MSSNFASMPINPVVTPTIFGRTVVEYRVDFLRSTPDHCLQILHPASGSELQGALVYLAPAAAAPPSRATPFGKMQLRHRRRCDQDRFWPHHQQNRLAGLLVSLRRSVTTNSQLSKIGSIQCSQIQFGIEPNCDKIRMGGASKNYTYFIDPIGPHRNNTDPLVAECQFIPSPPQGYTITPQTRSRCDLDFQISPGIQRTGRSHREDQVDVLHTESDRWVQTSQTPRVVGCEFILACHVTALFRFQNTT
ncbi:hypothetical protein Btru_041689 [Bulinus truncatus]|nr:hypothetical protein Btru_041689 [Bulinus truncatus]